MIYPKDDIDEILTEIATSDAPQLTDDEWNIITDLLTDYKDTLID